MLNYLVKRVLFFIPTLFAISLITFFLSINAPGDPVEVMLNRSENFQNKTGDKEYFLLRKQLGLDLPVFYFSISNLAAPDTLYRIPIENERKMLYRLCKKYGCSEKVFQYYFSLKNLLNNLNDDKNLKSDSLIFITHYTENLLTEFDEENIKRDLNLLHACISTNSSFQVFKHDIGQIQNSFSNILSHKNPFLKFIPAIHLHGFGNQYHLWLVKFIHGDFGISYQDKRPVSSVIYDAIGWTLMICFLAVLISYLIAVPLGVKSAIAKVTKIDRAITTFLYVLHSLPNFWVATLLIIFFAGGDYLDLFPSFGLGNISPDTTLLERISDTMYHLILPLICWTYASFAYLSRQVRSGMLNVLAQDFITTARAKGVSEKKVIWRHAFRNSLLPLITIFASVFPFLISGSFVLEYIFSIPGMGKLTYEALLARNYPVVFTTVMFASILTMVGMLVADILYAIADPRISFASKSTSENDF